MNRVSAPGYDLFKLIVALILVLILILIFLRGCNPVPPVAALETTTPVQMATESASLESSTDEPANEPTIVPTVIPPTPTPTVAAAESPTPIPATATSLPGSADVSCNTSMPSRLQVGQNARTLTNLNMRNAPDIQGAFIQTNRAGTQVEIIGGPECNPQGERAYLWWQIRLGDSMEGWSAETPLNERSYFLEPIP